MLKPADFIDAVLNRRPPNPFMSDVPQRIATDTSQKLPIRFGETVKAYKKNLSTDNLILLSQAFDPGIMTLGGCYVPYIIVANKWWK